MKRFILTTVAAIGMAVSGMAIAPVSAQDLELRLDRGGPSVRLRDDCDSRYEDCYSRREVRRERRGCSTGRALDKAERMGIRRARIVDAGRRTIEVGGRNRYGERTFVTFSRQWGCPVIG
ncbi:MAG: hypothetical protein AB7P20_17690 [Rhizobiaceae bacterium]